MKSLKAGFMLIIISLSLSGISMLLAGCGGELDPKHAPKIPHNAKDSLTCLKCHQDGKKGAQITPHPEQPNCLKCHQVK